MYGRKTDCECEYSSGELMLDWGVAIADCVKCGLRVVMNTDPYDRSNTHEGERVLVCAECGLPSYDDNPNGATEVCFGFCFDEEE